LPQSKVQAHTSKKKTHRIIKPTPRGGKKKASGLQPMQKALASEEVPLRLKKKKTPLKPGRNEN